MKKSIKKIMDKKYWMLLLVVLFMSGGVVYAQGPGFEDDVVDEVPLDGGVSALAVAGVAYGVKKLKDRRKGSSDK
jgi:hypothetical protein